MITHHVCCEKQFTQRATPTRETLSNNGRVLPNCRSSRYTLFRQNSSSIAAQPVFFGCYRLPPGLFWEPSVRYTFGSYTRPITEDAVMSVGAGRLKNTELSLVDSPPPYFSLLISSLLFFRSFGSRQSVGGGRKCSDFRVPPAGRLPNRYYERFQGVA